MKAELKTARCAVYTRVSSDSGLEQDFNSLDAQREAAEAFVKSQSSEGWRLIEKEYCDGGFSGGSLERPALQDLLKDVRERRVDVIVVYKVDRLTRSLADFAKLVEQFDQHGASFVSVTQAFNTTNSMGRLTLNVLLSFAQFEREVTAERIRDKIAASKKKGIWMGGPLPLGYRVESRKLVIAPDEAQLVRMIFTRYLELGSTLMLLEDLHKKGVRTRTRYLANGKMIGGVPFMRGPLNYLLRNRIYLGELPHHDSWYPAEHEPIVERATFDAVQTQLEGNIQSLRRAQERCPALLQGKLFDDRQNLMTPTRAQKGAIWHRYYTSRMVIERRRSEAGSVFRINAAIVENAVLDAVRSLLSKSMSAGDMSFLSNEDLSGHVNRVVVHPDRLVIAIMSPGNSETLRTEVAWKRPPKKPKREILLPHADASKDNRPIKAEVREGVVRAIALGRKWLSELIADPQLTLDVLATREGRSRRSIGMLLSLNFVAPDIVRALISGKLPRGIGITKLVHLPASWDEQRLALGIEQSSVSRI